MTNQFVAYVDSMGNMDWIGQPNLQEQTRALQSAVFLIYSYLMRSILLLCILVDRSRFQNGLWCGPVLPKQKGIKKGKRETIYF
jgi:hypothetical protein